MYSEYKIREVDGVCDVVHRSSPYGGWRVVAHGLTRAQAEAYLETAHLDRALLGRFSRF